MDMSVPVRVLFVCIGNSCRSPMAEAIALAKYPHLIKPSSAGVSPAPVVQPQTFSCLNEIGVELDRLKRPIPLKKAAWQETDLIVNMSGVGVLGVIPKYKGGLAIWEIPDPMGRPIQVYRQSRDMIVQHIDQLAEMLLKQAPTQAGA